MVPIHWKFEKLTLKRSGAAKDSVMRPGSKVVMTVPSLGRAGVEVSDRRQASGARHVLHQHAGIARNCAAEMARQQPRILIIAAARRIPDHQGDGPALEEFILGGERMLQARTDQQCESRRNRPLGGGGAHVFLLFLAMNTYRMALGVGSNNRPNLTMAQCSPYQRVTRVSDALSSRELTNLGDCNGPGSSPGQVWQWFPSRLLAVTILGRTT